MTDDLGFDSTDSELKRQLGSAAPAAGDVEVVLDALRPRLIRARRRRQAGMLAVGAAAVALLAGVAVAATDPGSPAKVRVPPATRPPVTLETGPQPTTPPETTVAVTTPDGGTPAATSPATPIAPDANGSGTPSTTVDDHGGNQGPGSSGSGSSGSGSSGSGSSGSSGGSGSGSSGTSGGSG